MGFFDFLFKPQELPQDVKEAIEKGCPIVDVRTPMEYGMGHIEGSINMPVGNLSDFHSQLKELPTPIITCCRSGNRSGQAANQLNAWGIKAVNGGAWSSLNKHL